MSAAQPVGVSRNPWVHIALGVVFGFIAAAAAPEALAKGVYTVAKVKVDVTAKNAVEAKKKALQQAEQRAIQIVFKRIAPFSAYERLPRVKASLAEEMLANYSVRREANSATQYLATLDYEFNARVVREFLAGHDIPFSDAQAPQATVIPVYIEAGAVVAHGRDPWRKAWLDLDLEHALTPVKLGRHGPDLKPDQVQAILGGDQSAFAALREKYGQGMIVLAIAEPTERGGRLVTRLYGFDAVGAIALARTDRVYVSDLATAAGRAAAVSLAILEARWKLTYSPSADEHGATALRTVSLTVEFAGLAQWQRIRTRLAKVPGVQAIEVKSLSARAAHITFRYAGDAQRLARQLAANNMTLQDVGGVWVVRGNE